MELLFYILLGITSVVGLAYIIERAWALRWSRVIPPAVQEAVDQSLSQDQLPKLRDLCQSQPSTLSRLLVIAIDRIHWPKAQLTSALEVKARQELVGLNRGLVVLEIVVGIAPLLGLAGTIFGLITLFAELGQKGLNDQSAFAAGIAIALNATLFGLMISIPALVAWSYYNSKVESLGVELETICDEFLQSQQSATTAPASKTGKGQS